MWVHLPPQNYVKPIIMIVELKKPITHKCTPSTVFLTPASYYRATTSGDWRCAVLSSSSPAITLDRSKLQQQRHYQYQYSTECIMCCAINRTARAASE
uniref:Uncharacterized protein n=1 Tax=Oryza meridionalis TaxID=40149 RepID=A0A0E0CQX2_9ORYZ